MDQKGVRSLKNFIQRHLGMIKTIGGVFFLVITFAAIMGVNSTVGIEKDKTSEPDKLVPASTSAAAAKNSAKIKIKEEKPSQPSEQERKSALIEEADLFAASYDYDKAMETIKTWPDYGNDPVLKNKLMDYETVKATLVEVDLNEVTHVFYHSLVVDPQRCFANQENDRQAAGNNQWMTTIEEFKKITQEMYNRGYVLVSIHDLAQETTAADGNRVFAPGKIMLPPGKKAFVLSVDDLSYYHSYVGYGFASKMILKDGKLKNEYINENGETEIGDFDVVPILDRFIEEHPDASYRGARGSIALTGYNGILGYRTDQSYQDVPVDLDADKAVWLQEHAAFSLDQERAEAKRVADAMKAEGWEFANHTWGHLKVGEASLERLIADTQKWKQNVEPIVGSTDTIIFAHGEDLQQWGDYDKSNEKFQYFYQEGFRFFCNVDSNQYQFHMGDTYIRQGRRNLDGYRIYFNAIGEMNSLSDLFDANQVIDPLRPPVHRLEN